MLQEGTPKPSDIRTLKESEYIPDWFRILAWMLLALTLLLLEQRTFAQENVPQTVLSGLVVPESMVADLRIIDSYYQPWDTNYRFEVQDCVIQNGSSVILTELQRFDSVVNQLSFSDRLNYFWEYFYPLSGEMDQFGAWLEQQLGCQQFSYQIGQHNMDQRGFGNLVYGYALEEWPFLEDLFARLFHTRGIQGGLEGFLAGDFPNDLSQRQLGMLLAEMSRSTPLLPETVEELAEEAGLF